MNKFAETNLRCPCCQKTLKIDETIIPPALFCSYGPCACIRFNDGVPIVETVEKAFEKLTEIWETVRKD